MKSIVSTALAFALAAGICPQPARAADADGPAQLQPLPGGIAKPGALGGVAQASPGCLAGNYLYGYRITAGMRTGDAWQCCVPTGALFRASFRCAGLQVPRPQYGTANDQKVQFCQLLDAKSPTPHYVPACKASPTSVDMPR